MDTNRHVICLLIALALLVAPLAPAGAAPFDPSVLKATVDDSLWLKYHAAPEPPDGDLVKLYRVKKAEVAILSGSREFAAHTFTAKDNKPHTFSIPHGVPNLKVRLRTWTADDQEWTTLYDYKEIGGSLTVRAVPNPLAVYTPGI
jgi:hypothetical protein